MNQKSLQERAFIIQLLVEGNSVRGAARIADVSKDTVMKLLVDVGDACLAYQDAIFVDLKCETVQVDEIWSFVYAKDKNAPPEKEAGTVWTWVAIDAHTKLVPCWYVGTRTKESAHAFIQDLAPRLNSKINLISDGLGDYVSAVEEAFGIDVNYAMLNKMYEKSARKRGQYVGASRKVITGAMEEKNISTSYVEVQNSVMRRNIKRFARKTNAHSKKLHNYECAIALHFMFYNFCRVHHTLRITPAMAAGLTDHIWGLEEMLETVSNYRIKSN